MRSFARRMAMRPVPVLFTLLVLMVVAVAIAVVVSRDGAVPRLQQDVPDSGPAAPPDEPFEPSGGGRSSPAGAVAAFGLVAAWLAGFGWSLSRARRTKAAMSDDFTDPVTTTVRGPGADEGSAA